jgi:hypothetical protein
VDNDGDDTGAGYVDDVSGVTLDGLDVTDLEVIDLVRTDGSLTIVRGPAARLRRSRWAEQWGALALTRGVQTSIRDSGRLGLILDVDWSGWVPPPGTLDTDSQELSRSAHPSGHPGPRGGPGLPTRRQ